MNEITEFATLKGVKMMRAGTFYPREGGQARQWTITDDELERYVLNFQECQDFLRSCVGLPAYPENDHIRTTKIPGFINLNHGEDLPDSFVESIKQVSVSLYTKVLDGVKWLMADFANVRDDVANFLQRKYPARSIEILPTLYHPGKKKVFQGVPRAFSFLDPRDMAPAVPELTDKFVVAYQQTLSPDVLVFFLTIEPQEREQPTNNKENIMSEDIKTSPGVDVAEFQKIQAQVAEFQAQAEIATKRAEKLELELRHEQEQRERNEILVFCKEKIAQGYAPALFPQDFIDFTVSLENSTVLEFSEEKKQTRRQYFLDFTSQLLEMKKEDSYKAAIGEFAKADHKPKVTDINALRLAKVKEIMARDNLDYSRAYDVAINENPHIY